MEECSKEEKNIVAYQEDIGYCLKFMIEAFPSPSAPASLFFTSRVTNQRLVERKPRPCQESTKAPDRIGTPRAKYRRVSKSGNSLSLSFSLLIFQISA